MQVPVTSRNVQNRANISAWYLRGSFDHVINIAFNCKFEPMRQVDRVDAEQRDPHKFAADASVVRNPPNLNSFKGRNFISSLRFPTHAAFCEWCSANRASFFVSLPPGVQLHARACVRTCIRALFRTAVNSFPVEKHAWFVSVFGATRFAILRVTYATACGDSLGLSFVFSSSVTHLFSHFPFFSCILSPKFVAIGTFDD